MSCNNCNESNPISVFNINALSGCEDCTGNCPGGCANTDCIFYQGPSLVCSTIDSGDTLSIALQKIDDKLCTVAGVFGVYNFSCLDDTTPITTEQEIVETISDYVCTLRTDFDDFVSTTFTSYQDVVDTRFVAIENPGITCSAASVTNSDTLIQVLNKYCTAISSIQSSIDLSAVDWDQCITVNPDPTTVHDAFDVLIDQICDIRTIANAAASLPVFNNTTSCLASPGTTDSLVTTINKIKDRLCLTPTLNNDNLTSSCITIPSADLDLEATLQAILDKLDAISSSNPTFDSGDFVVTATNISDPCDGVTVALSTPIAQDRFVAVDNSDSSPGTLSAKLTAGAGITLDTSTTPGTMIISSSVASTDTKVKAFSSDPNAAGYLIDKLAGLSANGLSIGLSSNGLTGTVDITPSFTWGTFVRDMMSAINADPILKAEVCAFIASCGCNCGADDCTTYLISNSTGNTVEVTFTECVDGNESLFNLPDGSSVEVCARTGTVSAAGCAVTSTGDCGGGTTTTTSTSTTSTSTSSSSTTTTTTTAAPCEEYINNSGSMITGVNYTACDGTVVTGDTLNNGDSVCIQPGTGSGNFGFLVLLGGCNTL